MEQQPHDEDPVLTFATISIGAIIFFIILHILNYFNVI